MKGNTCCSIETAFPEAIGDLPIIKEFPFQTLSLTTLIQDCAGCKKQFNKVYKKGICIEKEEVKLSFCKLCDCVCRKS